MYSKSGDTLCRDNCLLIGVTFVILARQAIKNITGYQRDLLKMRVDHATSLLPNPIVVLDL